MWLGIDFGTTNSAIAFSDGERVHTFKVDPQLTNLLPSLLYITRNFEHWVGTQARDTYLAQNVDRPSLYKPQEVGVIRLDVGDGGGYKEIYQAVVVMVDVLAPGRLLRSIKTGLRTIDYLGSYIFGREYRVEALISILLAHLCAAAEPLLGAPVTQVVMGRPVKFSDNPAVDRQAEARIVAAARLAGITEVVFLPEPIAAAYAYHRDFVTPRTALIFDFGGGTLDLTVARLGGATPQILATEGVLIGGDDLDRRLFQHLLPHFGEGAQLIDRRLDGSVVQRPIPRHVWGSLLDWQTIEELKRSDVVTLIEDAARPGGSSNPRALQALHDLIHNNLYFSLMQEIERTKIALSRAERATLRFRSHAIDIEETITRGDFERLIGQEVQRIARALASVVAAAGLTADDIEVIVGTGGSSQIPVFEQLLIDSFPRAELATRSERNLTGVVQGLGIYGADRDLQQAGGAAAQRRQLLDDAQTQPAVLPRQGRAALRAESDFSHAVVGLGEDDSVQLVAWDGGRPPQTPTAVRLQRGTFLSQAGRLLLGSTHSRFVLATLGDIQTLIATPDKALHQLKLDYNEAEAFILAQRWSRSDDAPLLILVTRWGNVRAFPRRLVDKPLLEQGMWKIDMRGKADPPAALVSAHNHSQLLLLTAGGRATRLWARKVSVRGNRALKLTTPEPLYVLALDHGHTVAVLLADGRAGRLAADELPLAPESGSAGKHVVRAGSVAGLLPLKADVTPRALTSKGRLLDVELAAVPLSGWRPVVETLLPQERIVDCWLP